MKLYFVFLVLFISIRILNAAETANNSTTTSPATTVSPNATSTNNTALQYNYYVCGNETKLTDCTCTNNNMECEPSQKTGSYYWYDNMNPPFTTMNIQILNQTFIPKNVTFLHNRIRKLQNGRVLPGHEHTVEYLKLFYNRINEIENGTFDKFTSLKTLDMQCNFLRNITAAVLTKELGSTLTVLKIADNAFRYFDMIDFTNMEKLEELDISENGIIGFNRNNTKYIFPSSLANLKILDISSCSIQILNENVFMNLKSLETLKLHQNRIMSLPKSMNALTNLRNLNMQSTRISSLNYTVFQNLSKLETLDMSSSQLVTIDDCSFCNKPNLKSVMLYGNEHLSYIHENAFGNVLNGTSPPLESFSLEACNLSIIPENLLNWHTVKEFGLGRNPFTCNCSMAWLINDILSPTHSIKMKSFLPDHYSHEDNAFKCNSPYGLRNTPFSHISQKLCPVKEKKEAVYEKISVATLFLFIVAFILGMVAVLLAQRLVLSRTTTSTTQQQHNDNGFVNQNFGDERAVEEFDEVKSYY